MQALLLAALILTSSVDSLPAEDPLTRQALTRIAEVEAAEPDVAAGDTTAANAQLERLAWAGKRLVAVNDKTEAGWVAAEKRYRTLWDKLQKKANATPAKPYDYAQLVQLNEDIAKTYENLKLLDVKHLADAQRAAGFRQDIAALRARLAPFPKTDEDVELVTGNLDNLQKLFDIGIAQVARDRAASGDVAQELETLKARYDLSQFPARLEPPFEADQIRSWAAQVRGRREVDIPRDLEWLRSIAGNTAISAQKVNSTYNYLTGSWTRRLDEAEQEVRERVASEVKDGLEAAQWILETDVKDQDQVLNRILGQGAFDENMQRLRDAERAVTIARVYDDAMPAPAVLGTNEDARAAARPDRAAEAATVARAIAHLKALAVTALDAVRMPAAVSLDPELLKTAEETLRRPEYEVHGWRRLVVNAPLVRKQRREAWLAPGAAYITLSFYDYTWDEYQVTTAEQVGEEVWLFANTLRHYRSGDPTTPVGRWIVARRFELTPILPEHVQE